MKRVRYLPPGSMRRQRRLGRLEGSVGTLLLVCAIGFGLVSATPAELYQPAPATRHPTPAGEAAPGIALQIPPCTGAGKDCSALDPAAADAAPGAPHPRARHARPDRRRQCIATDLEDRMNTNPLPLWARVLAVVLVFGGYGLLEWQDAATERGIARADARGEVVAEARPQ